MFPDILKKSDLCRASSISEDNENDEELNKPFLKSSTEKQKKPNYGIIKEKRNIISNLVKENASSLNNLNITSPKR